MGKDANICLGILRSIWEYPINIANGGTASKGNGISKSLLIILLVRLLQLF